MVVSGQYYDRVKPQVSGQWRPRSELKPLWPHFLLATSLAQTPWDGEATGSLHGKAIGKITLQKCAAGLRGIYG